MQRKCHRCDRLFTPDSHSTWCPDCRAGKPVAPRKTKKQNKVLCGDWVCEDRQRKGK